MWQEPPHATSLLNLPARLLPLRPSLNPVGEEPHTGIVAGITPGNPTLVTTVEDERLEFQDGALQLHGGLMCWISYIRSISYMPAAMAAIRWHVVLFGAGLACCPLPHLRVSPTAAVVCRALCAPLQARRSPSLRWWA